MPTSSPPKSWTIARSCERAGAGNGYVVEVSHESGGKMLMTGSPISLNGEIRSQAPPAPDLGQHTGEVMLEAGYSWEDIIRIRDAGAV